MKTSTYSIFRRRKGQTSTQEMIFRLLSERFPQTLAMLQQGLRQEFHTKLSFQAVRKCVLGLRQEGLLTQGQRGYQLNVDWLLHSRAELDTAIRRYRGGRGAALAKDASYQSFITHSLFETDSFWGEIAIQCCRNTPRAKRDSLISLNHYAWWLPLNLGREQEVWDAVRELGYRVHFVFTTRSASSQGAVKTYRAMNVAATAGVKLPIEPCCYYNVIGDTIIRVTIPPKLHEKIGGLFGSRKALSALPQDVMLRLGHEKTEIMLEVFKSGVLAQTLASGL